MHLHMLVTDAFDQHLDLKDTLYMALSQHVQDMLYADHGTPLGSTCT